MAGTGRDGGGDRKVGGGENSRLAAARESSYSPAFTLFAAFFVGNLFMNFTVILVLAYTLLDWLNLLWILWPLGAIYAYDVITSDAYITGVCGKVVGVGPLITAELRRAMTSAPDRPG